MDLILGGAASLREMQGARDLRDPSPRAPLPAAIFHLSKQLAISFVPRSRAVSRWCAGESVMTTSASSVPSTARGSTQWRPSLIGRDPRICSNICTAANTRARRSGSARVVPPAGFDRQGRTPGGREVLDASPGSSSTRFHVAAFAVAGRPDFPSRSGQRIRSRMRRQWINHGWRVRTVRARFDLWKCGHWSPGSSLSICAAAGAPLPMPSPTPVSIRPVGERPWVCSPRARCAVEEKGT